MDINNIQYDPDCAKYDPDLGYTLKPGNFIFANHEFSTTYHVNSLGVRDTEEALNSPQVVVLGDSYAMGWGVEQNETFAKVVEAETGLPVLNASVSSYGTAREMMLLKRVKMDKLKYLIIQYCNNDYEENLSFLNNGNKLVTMSREKYAEMVKHNLETIKYYPGKYFWLAAKVIGDNYKDIFKIGYNKKKKPPDNKPRQDEAKAFINVILHSGIDLNQVQLLVFTIEKGTFQDNFINSLKEQISLVPYPPVIKNMILLDNSECYQHGRIQFFFDGHFTPYGHRLVAAMITRRVASR
ncbi:MAG: SGNH/GDSL hydrolase family protein [Deltaproteobacteria bacterium]|nr:MAG: SGNH/GDSL hydrolase family protein [Deltaproteobacteria bacterium]